MNPGGRVSSYVVKGLQESEVTTLRQYYKNICTKENVKNISNYVLLNVTMSVSVDINHILLSQFDNKHI
jgi:hypothetical protein